MICILFEAHHAKEKSQRLVVDPLDHGDQTGPLRGVKKRVHTLMSRSFIRSLFPEITGWCPSWLERLTSPMMARAANAAREPNMAARVRCTIWKIQKVHLQRGRDIQMNENIYFVALSFICDVLFLMLRGVINCVFLHFCMKCRGQRWSHRRHLMFDARWLLEPAPGGATSIF